MSEIVVVDYGSGNVRSMTNALLKVAQPGQTVKLTNDLEAIAGAERVIVPGVGAFPEVRRKLDSSGVLPTLEKFRASGKPMLGICVGMQILADEGLEFERTPGLGWIAGQVRQLEPGGTLKLPHFGWSPVTPTAASPLFEGLGSSPYFYFVHSFHFACADSRHVAGTAAYGQVFAAAVCAGNVAGTQFHPEKSDVAGLTLLSNFCRWNP